MEITPVNDCPVPKGILLVIGGKENKEGDPENKKKPSGFIQQEILKTFIELTEKTDPCIEVITSASGDGEESFEEYKKIFDQLVLLELIIIIVILLLCKTKSFVSDCQKPLIVI